MARSPALHNWRQAAGDHCLFVAEVEHFASSDSAPLLFHGGAYFTLGSRL